MDFLKDFLKKRRNSSALLLVLVSAMLIPLFLNSCGDYDTVAERDKKINVLITPKKLNSWITNGYPGDEYGHNKVVVLHVGTGSHVPGAFSVKASDLQDDKRGSDTVYRSDGVSATKYMVASKALIDKVIQGVGIDGSAVIVLTASSSSDHSSLQNLAWTYFNFRYWGFPRNKLRVLDGFVDTTWKNAGFSLDEAAPKTPEATEYSVCNLTQEPDRFRAPLEDMIKVSEDDNPNTVVIDTRTADAYNGIYGKTVAKTSGFVAFEGNIRTAMWQSYEQLLNKVDGTFLPKTDSDTDQTNDLTSLFADIDPDPNLSMPVNSSTTAYIYSRTGLKAAITFLALDGVLDYPVRLYDGGWLEWGQMAGGDKGDLDADSRWRTDKAARSGIFRYNADAVPEIIVEKLSSGSFVDSDAANANAVNEEDRGICFAGGGGDAGGY